MAGTSTQDIKAIKTKVIQATLDLTRDISWSDISMDQIAEKSDVDIDNLESIFPEKSDILMAYARQIDEQVSKEFNVDENTDELAKDQLFDVLMERFDLLNENRASIISIVNGVTMDPKQMADFLPSVYKSMTKMLSIVNIPTDGWRGNLRILGLSGVYLKVLRDWVGDETSDMSITMSSLDQALSKVDSLATQFNF